MSAESVPDQDAAAVLEQKIDTIAYGLRSLQRRVALIRAEQARQAATLQEILRRLPPAPDGD